MTMERENELLRRALLGAAELDLGALGGEIPPPSPRQAKRMKAMLADPFGYARRLRRPAWKKALHTAAMIAVTAALSISLLSAASPTVRAAIKAWFMEARQFSISYIFSGEAETEEIPYYVLTELPEGYAYAEEDNWTTSRRIRYTNAASQRITFEYTYMEEGSGFLVDTHNMTVRDILVNGCVGQLFLSSDPDQGSAILWMDEASNIQFFIDAFATEQELLHMAEHISLCKTEKP